MRKLFVIKAKLPITVVGKDKQQKTIYKWHYFGGCADTVHQGQQGGITGTVTVNLWDVNPAKAAGFMSKQDADAWFKVIGLDDAKICFVGYLDSYGRVEGKNGLLVQNKPAYLIPGDTTFRIVLKAPPTS